MPSATNSPAPLLAGSGLTRRFNDRIAVDDVSFTVVAGESVAIVGPNGAGKTTLLSMIAGVQLPDAGELTLPTERIGWVPQRAAVYGKLSVRENLDLFATFEELDDRVGAVERTLERIGLADRADARAEELSGGMRQRVSIGIGLIADPPALLLDEPTAALDPLQRARLWELLGSLTADGITIVYSSHSASEVQNHADRVLVVDSGKLVYDGAPSAIGDDTDFENAFVEFLERSRAAGAGARP
ncbi:MAG: ABC transporter ATP-binding protein [Solirubrobacterales bacterium]